MRELLLTWNEYESHFKKVSSRIGRNEATILNHLNYAKSLYQKLLPVIYDLKHLSYHTGYKTEYIERAIARPQNFYRSFTIAKKNGKGRTITEPLPSLKEIQYWILNNILKRVKPNPINNAYTEGKSIVTNSKFHRKQLKVLNVDIKKYFDSIGADSVKQFFLDLGYNDEVSSILSKILTLNNGLPQGSPTSPYLSSILTIGLDMELLTYAKDSNLRYSRYADDITISGDFNEKKVIYDVGSIVRKHGFHLNRDKTSIKYRHQRQLVTGVVVNEKLSIKKNDLRSLRQSVYYIGKHGLDQHMQVRQIDQANYLYHLLGKVNYFLSVKSNDRLLLKYKTSILGFIKQYMIVFIVLLR